VIGEPSQARRRAVLIGFATTFVLVAVGVWLAAQSGLESATTSSTGYLRPILELTTNTWTYVLMLAFILRGVLLFRNRRYAEQAADVVGYATRSVRRLAEEAKEPDGTTRVIATSDEDRDAIEERILAALDGADDDRMQLNPELFEEPSAEDVLLEDGDLGVALDERDEHLKVVLDALEGRAIELNADLEEGTNDLLTMNFDADAVADAIKSGEDVVAPADLLGNAGEEALDEQNERLEEAEANLGLQEDVLETLATRHDPVDASNVDVVGDELLEPAKDETVDDEPSTRRGRLLGVLRSFFSGADVEEDLRGDDVEETTHRDEWLEEYKLLKLDLATSMNFDRLVWQFAVPALLTIVGLLIVARFWIQPYLYPPLFAAGGLVGLPNYVRASRKRSKRLEELRRDEQAVEWRDVAVLVKEVEVPETTLQYAWLAGDRYVHDDREEFASEVAHRAYELVNGLDASPSLLEKQADQIAGLKPDLHAFRDQEAKLVSDRLIEAVEASRDGLMPKAKLIEDVVEWDIEQRNVLPGERGVGHDPDVVRDAYRGLVPAALVEQEIPVSEDSDETITAVRLRTDPIPPEYGAIRARFSGQFANYAEWEPLYELPTVEDVLEDEPMLAGSVGYQGGESA
jgi:hypothetical protein